MIKVNDKNWCDCCREYKDNVDFVKFPAVDYNQYQEFCELCRKKFYAWKNREISISQLFNKDFKLTKGE